MGDLAALTKDCMGKLHSHAADSLAVDVGVDVVVRRPPADNVNKHRGDRVLRPTIGGRQPQVDLTSDVGWGGSSRVTLMSTASISRLTYE